LKRHARFFRLIPSFEHYCISEQAQGQRTLERLQQDGNRDTIYQEAQAKEAIMEIIPNVHCLSTSMGGVNVYVLLGPTLTLVDTGMPGHAGAILNYIRSLGRAPADLTRIVVTHHHVDHTGSLAELTQQTGARVLAHPADAPFITGERIRPEPRGILMRLLLRLIPAASRYTPVPVDSSIQDNDHLDLLSGAVVIHAPGHTLGSVALHFPAERLLITGDTINGRGGRPALPSPIFSEDMGQALASVRRLAALDFDVLCPGHGHPIMGGAAGQVQALL
jgi:glyoxylase-like metal-dependent hydrolase (beta-lactamase superfamily II)